MSHQPSALSFGRKPSGPLCRCACTAKKKKSSKWRNIQRAYSMNTAVCVWISCQRSRPCGALLRPRATILLHYPPLAASSSALPRPRVSAFVSQASSVSKPEHDHFAFVQANQVDLWTGSVAAVSWFAAKAICSRLRVLFYSHFDYVCMDYSCFHKPCTGLGG